MSAFWKSVCLFLLIGASPVFAQSEDMEVPDMEMIRDSVLDRNSTRYYPLLMERYLEGDTTLSLEEYRYLYLGYSFQEGYDPYRISPYGTKLREMYANTPVGELDCDTIIKYGQLAVADFPFDLREINMLIYAYKCKGDLSQSSRWEYALRSLIDAILSTGDGESPETAWHVIYTPHEYDIVNRLGLEVIRYRLEEPALDYLEVKENPFKINGYYFNVGRMREEYQRKFAQ